MRRRVPDALDPVDRVDRVQQLRELPRLRPELDAERVDVLAEQRDLAHALGGEQTTSSTSSSNGRETSRPRVKGTMQYEHFMLQPALICTQACWSRARLCGRCPVKPSNSKKPCAVSESEVRNSAKSCTWPGPNATSTNG